MITAKEPPNLRQTHSLCAEVIEKPLPDPAHLRKTTGPHDILRTDASINADFNHSQTPALRWCHHGQQAHALVLRATFTCALNGLRQIVGRNIQLPVNISGLNQLTHSATPGRRLQLRGQ